MTKKTKLLVYGLVIIMIFMVITLFSNEIRMVKLNDTSTIEKPDNLVSLNSFSWNLTGSPISIDDSNPNANWSYTALNYDWCSGSGSWSDPYVIEDVLIDGLDGVFCISIWGSNAYFIIRNCILYNVGSVIDYAPIQLRYTDNGRIVGNSLEDGQTGIYLFESDNNSISNNEVNDLIYGIHLEYSHYSAISNNDIETHSYGVMLDDSNYNNVSLNSLIDINNVGVRISSSEHNIVTKNTIIFPNWGLHSSGIEFVSSINNTISDNHIENGATGIFFYYSSRENVIKNNVIIDNLRGIHFPYDTTINNTIYNNCFVANDYYENARDDGSNNNWDNGSSGNYWDDYSGADNDNNGIGDNSYDIAGSAGSSDNFPLMECPFPLPQPESFNWLPIIIIIVISSAVVGIGLAIYFLKFRKSK
jgi:parallel beta-helix repeat protein